MKISADNVRPGDIFVSGVSYLVIDVRPKVCHSQKNRVGLELQGESGQTFWNWLIPSERVDIIRTKNRSTA